MVTIVCYAISVYTIVLFIRIIWSWFRVPSSGPGRTIFEVIYDLTEPVLRPGPHRRHQTADRVDGDRLLADPGVRRVERPAVRDLLR